MEMIKAHAGEIFPALSVTVQVTGVFPSVKTEPEAREQAQERIPDPSVPEAEK